MIPVCYHPMLGSLYWDFNNHCYKLMPNDEGQDQCIILSQERADNLLVGWLANREGVIFCRQYFPPRAVAFLIARELEI